MLDYNQIKDLIKEIDSSSLRVFELEDSDIKLKLSKNDENKPTNDLINDVSLSEPSLQSSNKTTFELNTTEVNDESTTLDENITIIKSPLVGTYYSSSKPGGDSYVTVGSNVKKGDVLCIIEAMKIMNEIQAPVSGIVTQIFVENEAVVEFNQPLIEIKA